MKSKNTQIFYFIYPSNIIRSNKEENNLKVHNKLITHGTRIYLFIFIYKCLRI